MSSSQKFSLTVRGGHEDSETLTFDELFLSERAARERAQRDCSLPIIWSLNGKHGEARRNGQEAIYDIAPVNN